MLPLSISSVLEPQLVVSLVWRFVHEVHARPGHLQDVNSLTVEFHPVNNFNVFMYHYEIVLFRICIFKAKLSRVITVPVKWLYKLLFVCEFPYLLLFTVVFKNVNASTDTLHKKYNSFSALICQLFYCLYIPDNLKHKSLQITPVISYFVSKICYSNVIRKIIV